MENKQQVPKYAFLMIDYDTPEFIKDLHNSIKDNELYTVEGNNSDYGKETESHITIVPCLDNDVNVEELKPYLNNLSDYKVVLTDISKFECNDYDVLKCNASSFKLNNTNEKIKKDFELHSEYKDDYHPHLTVAYMKKGMADKYLKKTLDKLIVLEPKNFRYSWWEGDNMKTKTFEKVS